MSEEWLDELAALINRARSEGKWLWCSYQDLWFSPDDLAAANARGRFQWGAVNWKLRNPQERLAEAEKREQNARAETDRIRASMPPST